MIRFKGMTTLALALLLVLSACGGTPDNNSNNKTANNDSAANNKNGNDGKEKPPEKKVAEFDLGGREIKISNWWDGTPKADTVEGEKALARIKSVEEKYNVKIKYVNTDYWETAKKVSSTVMAGEPFADIVNLPDGFIWGLLSGGFLTPLSDYIDFKKDSVLSADILDVMHFGTNKIYGFYPPYAPNMSGVFYNKRMFQEAGIKSPQQLMDEDKWNWDTFLEAAKKLTMDKNGDGKIDQYGLAVAHYMLGPYLVYSNDANYYDETNRKVVLDSPNAMEAFNFMHDLYNKHKVIKANEGDDWNNPAKFFAEGQIAMYPGGTWELGRIKSIKDEWGYVYLPKGPKGKSYVDPMTQAVGMVIPKGVKDPRAVYLIWQDLQDFKSQKETQEKWAEQNMPDEGSYKNVLNKDGKMVRVFGRFGGLGIADVLNPITAKFITGEETPASGIAKIKSQAQAKVDEKFSAAK